MENFLKNMIAREPAEKQQTTIQSACIMVTDWLKLDLENSEEVERIYQKLLKGKATKRLLRAVIDYVFPRFYNSDRYHSYSVEGKAEFDKVMSKKLFKDEISNFQQKMANFFIKPEYQDMADVFANPFDIEFYPTYIHIETVFGGCSYPAIQKATWQSIINGLKHSNFSKVTEITVVLRELRDVDVLFLDKLCDLYKGSNLSKFKLSVESTNNPEHRILDRYTLAFGYFAVGTKGQPTKLTPLGEKIKKGTCKTW
jgi:hypothetical protein